ncbi:MAG: TIGR01212 family radical SAM protein [Ignavibacteriae bacterium HGW-Ignavibacteriae-2]|nr:MAG: TIGR01212 family radical SAM protein [Ignavibacteriae bacterium HGW-Ignavibacteriae-2]
MKTVEPKQRFNRYSDYLKRKFGQSIRKIPINAGFTCPNRDGSKGIGGCTYCNNVSFNPFYGQGEKSVLQQLEEGLRFYSKRYSADKFLAYFQAYTNTYAELKKLKETYSQVLDHPQIIGIVLGTRPDCVNEIMLDYFQELSRNYYIAIEYGIESSNNATLAAVNRCHSYEESIEAIEQTAKRGIEVGAHIILGLPGETKDMMLNTADRISRLPLNFLKIHQLQIIKQTMMAKQFKETPDMFTSFSPEEYIDLVIDFLERLNPGIIIERFISESPPKLIIYPRWKGLRTYDFVNLIEKRLDERNTFQGKLFTG